MSSQEPEPIYCQVQDVGDLLNLQVSSSTTPSDLQIKKFINNNQEIIEAETKHAWREVQADEEIHDLESDWEFGHGFVIGLLHRKLRALDYTKGDRIQFWNGNAYQDILQSNNSLDENVKVDLVVGRVSFKSFAWSWTVTKRYRFVYRYGDTVVPRSIRQCCAKMAAVDIISGSMFWNALPIGGDKFSINDTVRIWREDIEKILFDYSEIVAIY